MRLDEFYNFVDYVKLLRPKFEHEKGQKHGFWVTVGVR